MSDMTIAILMGIYNGDQPRFLTECLESLSQESLMLECTANLYIHIDGGISDKLRDVIAKYSIVYKIVESKENIGLASGLNKLIDQLEDETYVFRMDADDVVEIGRFRKQIAFMESKPHVDFSGGSIIEFTENETLNGKLIRYPNEPKEITTSIIKGSPFAHVTICFRGTFFNKYGLYPVNYLLNEDIAYWFKALKLGAVGSNIDDSLVYVRMDSAYSRRGFSKAFNEFKVYYEICKWQKKLPIFPLLRILFRIFPNKLVKIIYNSSIRKKFLGR